MEVARPCGPKTLTRTARDFARTNPAFAVEAGLAALRWLVRGYGYEVTSVEVRAAYSHTLTAASTGRSGPASVLSSTIRLRAADSSQVSSGRKWAWTDPFATLRADRP